MAQVKVEIIFETDAQEQTERAINKYLKETLDNGFLEPNEKIISLNIIEEENG